MICRSSSCPATPTRSANAARAVAAAAESMEAAGAEDLTLRLFPGMRHEILNELGKQEVYDFILNWINSHN